MNLFELTQTPLLWKAPHTNKQTNKQAVRRGQKNRQFWPPKNTEKYQIWDQFEAQHAAKTTGTKSQRKLAIAPRESRPNGGDKNGSERELLQRSRWRQGLMLVGACVDLKIEGRGPSIVAEWVNEMWARSVSVHAGYRHPPHFTFINTNNSSLGWETMKMGFLIQEMIVTYYFFEEGGNMGQTTPLLRGLHVIECVFSSKRTYFIHEVRKPSLLEDN